MITKAIHRYSDRGKCPFVAVNCAAIPRDLLQSELFGHVTLANYVPFAVRVGVVDQEASLTAGLGRPPAY